MIKVKEDDYVLLKHDLYEIRVGSGNIGATNYEDYLNSLGGQVVQVQVLISRNNGELGTSFGIDDNFAMNLYEAFVEKILTPEDNPEYFL